MSVIFEWWRDVPRYESVRAAEDAAAVPSMPAIQHRDLPEVVAALTERVARLEAAQAAIGTGDVFRQLECGSTADEIARLTVERDALIRERDEARRMRIGFVPATTLTDLVQERDATRAECERLRARVAELEAAPPPRGWLTSEERELIAGLTDDDHYTDEGQNIAKALLARETPPRVKVPTWMHDDVRRCVIDAIRAAGGEVE